MERASAPAPYPALIAPGTVVGSWRVVAPAGRGIHGAVYRAVQVDKELSTPVALKLALSPGDPRFAREVELLSLMRHPSIPRLWDSGEWQPPSGARYPFIAMEWVDGEPLYDQPRRHAPSDPWVIGLLAQLASALQALHARGAVHRDMKGGNVLVRRSDGRAVLMDFGSGIYPGAATLTPPGVYPGTPAYRSPEAGLFELQSLRDSSAHYSATPADDLYALGVTACRLLTGEYPAFSEPYKDETGTWRMETVIPPPALLSDPRIPPPLRALILRLLSVRPEERGTAAQLAEALEQAAKPTIAGNPPPRSTEAPGSTQPTEKAADSSGPGSLQRAPTRSWWPWLGLTAAGVTLAVGAWWVTAGQPVEKSSVARAEIAEADRPDAGTTGLGEAATAASIQSAPELHAPEALAEEPLPELVPGQTRPDARGRCPRKGQVVLNGGCWVETNMDREGCETLTFSGYKGTMFRNKCYMPAFTTERPSTSCPLNRP